MGSITGLLPEALLRRMSPADRKALGQKSSADVRKDAVAKDEKTIQRQIADYLRVRGLWFAQSRMDRRTSNTVGTPDFVFPFAGRYVAWEVKCPWAAMLRTEQAEAAADILAQGGEWRMVTSLVEAKAHLDELERGAR